MTAEQRDQVILKAWQDKLRKTEGIPANLEKQYSAWLRGIVKAAAATLQPQPAAGGEEGGGEQGGQEGAA